jgi:hypothetical protein
MSWSIISSYGDMVGHFRGVRIDPSLEDVNVNKAKWYARGVDDQITSYMSVPSDINTEPPVYWDKKDITAKKYVLIEITSMEYRVGILMEQGWCATERGIAIFQANMKEVQEVTIKASAVQFDKDRRLKSQQTENPENKTEKKESWV